jgi:2-oxoglutarate ferredoxin oxidoreductase subunit alpha
MERLVKKFETAKQIIPKPVERKAGKSTKFGVLYFGSTSPAMKEALDVFDAQGTHIDAMRLRAFPFHSSVMDFIEAHDHVFLVEQNRDGQLRSMLVNEGNLDSAQIIPVLHYDGTPITARFIVKAITDKMALFNVTPLKKVAQ